jgi:hypothetical protein
MATLKRFSAADLELLKTMAAFGHPGTAIAAKLNRTPGAIRAKCVEMGVRLRPNRKPKFGSRFRIPDRLWGSLKAAADARAMKPTRFVHLILETIARDQLYAAILDAPPPKSKPSAKVVSVPKRQRAPVTPLWGHIELGAQMMGPPEIICVVGQ